jgi:hypothetical protein
MEITYSSKIISHSISTLGNDIITWEITLPKWLLAEFNTHKVEIERNSASSRAVPISIIIDMIREFPVMPFEWRYNAKGMEAPELMTDEDERYANEVWLDARDLMVECVRKLQKLPSGRSADKQRTNRLLEPWMWTVVVCTMTGGGKIGINNFFGLRDTKQAQPEFQLVAHMMHGQYHDSEPVHRLWHLPYIDEAEFTEQCRRTYNDNYRLAIKSSARCGRVTHYRQGQEFTDKEDMARGLSFAEHGHFSPLRHAAISGDNKWYGNMYGWQPISKKMMTHDYITKCCERAT